MSINLNVSGNTQPLESAVQAAVNRIRRTPIKITVDDKGATQPLGNMKRGADEFSKSMEAANARIIAFGASMAIINGVADAFKAVVKNVVEVEKAMADINVVMGLSAQKLDQFSDGLFKVAKETAASFDVASAAAVEYARQGLKVEETLKRTKDALILTRLTGMDSANAVKALTAAMNTYGDQIKDTTQLVSKFAAVDVQFAVSAEDFADAISRTGQAAKSAGVDIDELVGLVTAAQQQTARGGKVIGNSFKTIFTRIGRTDTLNQLENLGIAVRDIEGNTLGAKRILTDLANTFDTLTESQKAQIAQTVGGVFQINVLKAVLSDAAKQNGILANATQISASATDEAIQKNEQLRNTMSAMASETGLALKEVSAQIGEIMLAPGMEKILNVVKSAAEGMGNLLGSGEGAGSNFAKGFLKGLGNVITGPGLVVMVAVFTKLLVKAVQYANTSLKSLIGVTSESQKQKAIQTSLVNLFGQNAALSKEMLRTDISRTEKEKIILGLLRAQVAEANALNAISKQAASTLYSKGFGANLAPRRGRAGGHIPNFANPERAQAARGGYAAGSIRSMNMPGEGSVIYNSAETVKNFAGFKQPAIMPPKSSKAGQSYQQAFGNIHGFDPYAAGGYIPNFARGKKGAGSKARIDLSNPAIMEEIDRKTKYLNAGSAKYIGLSASAGPDKPRQTFYVAGGTGTDSGIFNQKGRAFYKKAAMQKAQPRKIDVEFKSLDEKDERRGKRRYDDEINEKLQKRSTIIASGILKTFGYNKMTPSAMEKDLPKSKMATVAGHIFEAVTKSVLRSVGAEAAIPDKETELIDLLPNQELYKLFGVDDGKGKSGAEAKINTNAKNVMSFARKIYSSDPTTKTPLDLKSLPKSKKAYGHIPNFANPLSDAISREKAAGVPVSQIRVGSHNALMSRGNPLGLGVTNTKDEPNGLRDVFGANGYVPNYAIKDWLSGFAANSEKRDDYIKEREKATNQLKKNIAREKELEVSIRKNKRMLDKSIMSKSAQDILIKRGNNLESKLNQAKQKRIMSEQRAAAVSRQASGASARGSMAGRMSGMGTMAMIGLPMVGGMMQEYSGGMGAQGGNQNMYAAGSAFTMASTGGMMGGMIGSMIMPGIGTAVGAAIGGIGGALMGWQSATQENTKALKESAKAAREQSAQVGSQFAQSMAQAFKDTGYFDEAREVGFEFGQMGQSGRLRSSKINLQGLKDFNRLTTVNGFGLNLQGSTPEGKKFREDMLKASGVNVKDVLRRGAGSPDLISKLMLDEYGINISSEQADKMIYTGNTIEKDIDGPFAGTYLAKERRSSADATRRMEDQILAMMGTELRPVALASALDMLPQDKKFLATAMTDDFTEAGAKVKKGEKAYFSVAQIQDQMADADAGAMKAAYADILKLLEQEDNVRKEQVRAVILQLDLQQAQLAAQKRAAQVQFDTEKTYLKQVEYLDRELKLSGQGLTEARKAQIKATRAEYSTQRQFDLEKGSIEGAYREKILDVSKDDTAKSALKQALFESNEDLKNMGDKIDVTKELAKLSTEELVKILKKAGISEQVVKNLETERIRRDNLIDKAEKERDLSIQKNTVEKEINATLAKRADKLKDLQRDHRMGAEAARSARKMRELDYELDAAKRLTAQGPGYKTTREREDFQLIEKEIQAQLKIKALQEELLEKQNKIAEENAKIVGTTGEDEKRRNELAQQSENLNKEYTKQISNLRTLITLEKERITNRRNSETFSGGLEGGFKKVREQTDAIYYKLGEQLPFMLRDGLVEAMQAGINGAENMGDVLRNIAIDFLGTIQRAMLQSAAGNLMGAMGFGGPASGRSYSHGGRVPAMVTNGEYVMGRDAVKKYGGGFMHRLNAGGKLPGYSNGGRPGSALAANFGGGEGYATGRRYQSQPMSGFFYSGQAGNVGLQEDAQYTRGLIEERMRKEQEKKAKKRALMQQILGTAISFGLSFGAEKFGNFMSEKRMLADSVGPSRMKNAVRPQDSRDSFYRQNPHVFAADNLEASSYFGDFLSEPLYNGGRIRKYASGGYISGKSGIDQIPAMLSEGEYVIRASSARQLGKPMLDRINAGKFNDGGAVTPLMENSETGTSSGNTNNINITVNMQKGSGKSEQQDSSGSGGTNPKDASEDAKKSNELAEKVRDQVISVIMDEQRPGGLLSD